MSKVLVLAISYCSKIRQQNMTISGYLIREKKKPFFYRTVSFSELSALVVIQELA